MSPRKDTREFGGRSCVLEESIVTDFALVHAWKGDTARQPRVSAQRTKLQPDCAVAGRTTIAEVEHLVEPGEIDPDSVHTPGVHVQRVVHVPDAEKPVDQDGAIP